MSEVLLAAMGGCAALWAAGYTAGLAAGFIRRIRDVV